MKKVLFMLFISVLVLVGCGEEDVSKEKDNEENNKEKDEQVESEPEYDLDEDKKLGITMDDIMEVESVQDEAEDYSEVKTYETDEGVIIDNSNSKHNTLHLYTYKFKGEDYPSVFLIRTNGVDVVNETANEILGDVSSILDEDVLHFSEEESDIKDEENEKMGIIFNDEHDIKELPVFLDDIATDDYFLDSDNVDFFNEASSHANYEELYENAKTHIEKNDIKDHDSAHEIIEILEPVSELMDEIEIQYDDFEDVSTVYYKGLTDISDNNHIVPFVTTNDGSMNLLVGFEKEGWLFSDRLLFNIDGEEESLSSYEPDKDTLGGSMIREEYVSEPDDELIKDIIDADEVKMRFEGEKGKLDYTLTDTDKKAIEAIQSFSGIRNDLSSLLFEFEKN